MIRLYTLPSSSSREPRTSGFVLTQGSRSSVVMRSAYLVSLSNGSFVVSTVKRICGVDCSVLILGFQPTIIFLILLAICLRL